MVSTYTELPLNEKKIIIKKFYKNVLLRTRLKKIPFGFKKYFTLNRTSKMCLFSKIGLHVLCIICKGQG